MNKQKPKLIIERDIDSDNLIQGKLKPVVMDK